MSNIKLGDRVRFVNENMEGIVTKVDGKTAGVTIEDDFEIPVMISELVKINEQVNTKAETPSITKKPEFVKIHSGIHIAFERITETELELKLHNSESDHILFAYYEKQKDGFVMKQTGKAEVEQTVSIGRFNIEQFNNWSEMAFQIMFINSPVHDFCGQLVQRFKFSAKEFHASFKQCYFLGKQAYSFRLNDSLKPLDIQKLKEKDFNEPVNTPVLDLNKKPAETVDLHIEKLTSDYRTMQAQQMIDLQMEVFTKSIEMAHVHKMKRIVFIHGVGNHFLKNKIKNYLVTHKQLIQKFRDADSLQFGGGATEVILT